MTAKPKLIIEQAEYMLLLANKIKDAAKKAEKLTYSNRHSGTINNLAPELAKAASTIKKMTNWNWEAN